MIIWPVSRHKILKNQTTANLLLRQQKSRVLSSPQDANSKLFTMCPSQGLHCDLDFHCSRSTLLGLLPVSPKVLFKETQIFTYTSSLGLEHFLHQFYCLLTVVFLLLKKKCIYTSGFNFMCHFLKFFSDPRLEQVYCQILQLYTVFTRSWTASFMKAGL